MITLSEAHDMMFFVIIGIGVLLLSLYLFVHKMPAYLKGSTHASAPKSMPHRGQRDKHRCNPLPEDMSGCGGVAIVVFLGACISLVGASYYHQTVEEQALLMQRPQSPKIQDLDKLDEAFFKNRHAFEHTYADNKYYVQGTVDKIYRDGDIKLEDHSMYFSFLNEDDLYSIGLDDTVLLKGIIHFDADFDQDYSFQNCELVTSVAQDYEQELKSPSEPDRICLGLTTICFCLIGLIFCILMLHARD